MTCKYFRNLSETTGHVGSKNTRLNYLGWLVRVLPDIHDFSYSSPYVKVITSSRIKLPVKLQNPDAITGKQIQSFANTLIFGSQQHPAIRTAWTGLSDVSPSKLLPMAV